MKKAIHMVSHKAPKTDEKAFNVAVPDSFQGRLVSRRQTPTGGKSVWVEWL